jgi:hypothetical protein
MHFKTLFQEIYGRTRTYISFRIGIAGRAREAADPVLGKQLRNYFPVK